MKIFVSYSRKDYITVYALVRELQRYGISIWIDQDDLDAGVRWDDTLESAIEEATHLLLMMSQNAMQSQNVRDEFSFAINEGKTILIAIIDDVKLPLRLHRFQYIDFRSNYDKAFERLLGQLSATDLTLEAQEETVPHIVDDMRSALAHEAHHMQESDDAFAIVLPEDGVSTDTLSRLQMSLQFEIDGQITRSLSVEKAQLKLGRSDRCDVKINVMQISREHLQILKKQNTYYVQDLGSSNGTWLNDQDITGKTVKLNHGDIINVAHAVQIHVEFSKRDIFQTRSTQTFAQIP